MASRRLPSSVNMPCSSIQPWAAASVQVVQIDLHDERVGIGVGLVERGRQRGVLRPKQVDGAGDIDGVVGALDRPDGRLGVDAQAAEQTDEGEEAPAGRA